MLPLEFHNRANPAARAVIAAKAQGKAFAYDKILWENNKAIQDSDLERYAEQAGLDVAQWKKDWNSPLVAAHVDHQAYLGAALGVRGTPNFFVNGNKSDTVVIPDLEKDTYTITEVNMPDGWSFDSVSCHDDELISRDSGATVAAGMCISLVKKS